MHYNRYRPQQKPLQHDPRVRAAPYLSADSHTTGKYLTVAVSEGGTVRTPYAYELASSVLTASLPELLVVTDCLLLG